MPERVVDLRSDTVTLPSPAMREAMYRAEAGRRHVRRGPDGQPAGGDDRRANLGKDAAVLLLSGTMGNLIGVLAPNPARG